MNKVSHSAGPVLIAFLLLSAGCEKSPAPNKEGNAGGQRNARAPAVWTSEDEQRAFDSMLRLKGFIYTVFNDGGAAGDVPTVFAALMPGLGMQEKRDGSDANNPTALLGWVVNTVPPTDLTGGASGVNIAEVFRKVLFTSAPKNSEAIEEQQLKLDKAAAIEQEMAQLLEPYVKYKVEYHDAENLAQQARIRSGEASSEYARAKMKAADAMDRWQVVGFKLVFEEKKRQADELLLRDGEPWPRWQEQYSEVVGNGYSPDSSRDFGVRLYPEYPTWTERLGWVKI